MGKVFEGIDEKLERWIGAQQLFFVATAPSGDGGHVNCSPKGPIESLRVLGPRRVAYLDLIGSGAETIAHLRENGRIVVMLCAFGGPPRIVRLHGRGRAVTPADPEFEELAAGFEIREAVTTGPARRSVVVVDVERIADSCGYGVPLLERVGDRPQQARWVERKLKQGGEAALAAYRVEHNTRSIDGLPALDTG
jgi:Pyridoxamine 5'-phosphate oxidase